MSVVNDDISRESRVSLVPTFKFSASVEAERERMVWVKPGNVRFVRGIETSGGFYVHRPSNTLFSFAVDETLSVGRAEMPVLSRCVQVSPFGTGDYITNI